MKIFMYDDDPDILFLASVLFRDCDITTFSGHPDELDNFILDEDVFLIMDYYIGINPILHHLIKFAQRHPNNEKIVYSAAGAAAIDDRVLEYYKFVPKQSLGKLERIVREVRTNSSALD